MEVKNEITESLNKIENKENKNVHDFQEHILQQKPANILVKSQSMTAWNAI